MEHIAKLRARFDSPVQLNDQALFILLGDLIAGTPPPKGMVANRDTTALREWVVHVSHKNTGLVAKFAGQLTQAFAEDKWDEAVWDDLQPLLMMFE